MLLSGPSNLGGELSPDRSHPGTECLRLVPRTFPILVGYLHSHASDLFWALGHIISHGVQRGRGWGGHPLILTSSWSRRVKRVGGLLHLTFGGVLRDCDSQYLAVFGWLGGSSLGSRFILFPVPLQLEEPFLKFLP